VETIEKIKAERTALEAQAILKLDEGVANPRVGVETDPGFKHVTVR
jgi:hypothetical protein